MAESGAVLRRIAVSCAVLVLAGAWATSATAATPHLERPRQRRAGLRHRPGPGRSHVADHRRVDGPCPRRRADSLGGLLFRNVPPGQGLSGAAGSGAPSRARSPSTPTRPAPWDPSDLQPDDPGQRLQYLTTRDGTKLAHRRAPADQPGGRARPPAEPSFRIGPDYIAAVSDADRVLGLRLRRPGRPGQRDRGARQPDGLRGGRRQHARDRLLGRRLQLLRAAAEPRRLRRDRDDRPPAVGARPQGRDDGHLLRRDQPAVHRPARSARTSRRSRRCRRSTRPRRRCTRAASSTPVSPSPGPSSASRRPSRPGPNAASRGRTSRSSRAIRPARPTRSCTARRPTCWRRSAPTLTTSRRSPIRSTRSRSSTRSTCRCSWPASGRTSRPAGTARTSSSTSPAPSTSGSPSPTAPTSTRSIPTPSTAGTTSWSCSSPTRRRSSTRAVIQAAAPVIYKQAMGDQRRDHAAGGPDPARSRPTESALAAFEKLPEVRVLFDNGAGKSPAGRRRRAIPIPGSSSPSRRFPIPGTRPAAGTSVPAERSAAAPPERKGINWYTSNAKALPLDRLRRQHRRRRAVGQRLRSGSGTGSRTRPAPRSRTSRRR